MKAIEFVADVDDRHCLMISLPESVMPGKVRVIVLTPDAEEDEAGGCTVFHKNGPKSCEIRVRIFTLRLHKPATIHSSSIKRLLGIFAPTVLKDVDSKLRSVLSL